MKRFIKFIRSLSYCKIFGHTIIKTNRNGSVWCISYTDSRCKTCGKDFGTVTNLHDD